jgi:predicted 3-demethylubiquinone-9 3-methyltransferase (glyoxalase superfamily)
MDELWKDLEQDGKVLMPLQAYPFSPYYGWIQDKYGFSWQLMFVESGEIPPAMPSLLFTQHNAGRADEASN